MRSSFTEPVLGVRTPALPFWGKGGKGGLFDALWLPTRQVLSAVPGC